MIIFVIKKLLFLPVLFFVFTPVITPVLAKIGVGVNTGTIQIEEKLKAGMIHQLPPITVINTGDEEAAYLTGVAYHQSQPELRPDQNWFTFSPREFRLAPGDGQLVKITLNLPLKTTPGNYFAYLEGRPTATVEKGKTTLGVAAASKLYFTVVPANLFYAVFYKVTGLFDLYAPWLQRGLGFASAIVALLLIKRFFNVQVNLKKRPSKTAGGDHQDE